MLNCLYFLFYFYITINKYLKVINVEQLIHLDNITINFKVHKDLNRLNIFFNLITQRLILIRNEWFDVNR